MAVGPFFVYGSFCFLSPIALPYGLFSVLPYTKYIHTRDNYYLLSHGGYFIQLFVTGSVHYIWNSAAGPLLPALVWNSRPCSRGPRRLRWEKLYCYCRGRMGLKLKKTIVLQSFKARVCDFQGQVSNSVRRYLCFFYGTVKDCTCLSPSAFIQIKCWWALSMHPEPAVM